MNNSKTAKIGENIAYEYLIAHKYLVLGRNVRYREGEIDLIALKARTLIFIEVKTRNNLNYGYAEESFNFIKKQRLSEAINKYLFLNKCSKEWRVDLITIFLRNKRAELRHYKSVAIDS